MVEFSLMEHNAIIWFLFEMGFPCCLYFLINFRFWWEISLYLVRWCIRPSFPNNEKLVLDLVSFFPLPFFKLPIDCLAVHLVPISCNLCFAFADAEKNRGKRLRGFKLWIGSWQPWTNFWWRRMIGCRSKYHSWCMRMVTSASIPRM